VIDVLDMLSYPADIRSLVLNRADAKLMSLEDVEQVLGSPITAQIPASRAVPISINKGIPITVASPGHAVSQAITKLARQSLMPAPVRGGRRRWRRG
jgi:pilus assembly protein CpaE